MPQPSTCSCRTLTPTCPCHLFFRGFKTAVCPASNPPNASAGLQGNNSYSYMPLPSVFQGVQDCRLPGLKPSKRFRRPPRQQLLQLHAPAICFSGSSRLPFDRPETLQTLPQASKATTLTATCPCHLFFREFKPAVCQPAKPPKCFPAAPMPFASSGIVLLWWLKPKPPKCFPAAPMPLASPGIVLLWWFKPLPARKTPSLQQMLPFASPGIVLLWWFSLPARKTPQMLLCSSHAVSQPRHCPFMVVQACRLPARKTPQMLPCSSHGFASPGIVLLWWFKPAVCPPLPCSSQNPAVCPPAKPPKCSPAAPMPFASPGIVLLWWFKPAVCQPAKPPKTLQLPNCPFMVVQACRLPARKTPQMLPCMPFASPGIVLLWWFKPAVCQPAKPPKCFPAAPMPFASPGIVLLWWLKPAVCQPAKPPKCFRCQPRHCPFMVVQACRLPARKTPQMLPCSSHAVCQPRHCPFMVVHLPARKTPQMLPAAPMPFASPGIAFYGGSSLPSCQPAKPPKCFPAAPMPFAKSLPFASPQNSQMLPCSSHAVCQPRHCPFMVVQACRLPRPQNPPNAPLQLPCRLPAPALSFYGGSSLPSASPQNPPNASLQLPCRLPAPALSFYGGSSLPFARPQNPPNASLQLPCRLPAPALSFYGGSSLPSASPQNPPNASLQLPCRLPAPALSFYGGSSLPFASPQNPTSPIF